MCRQAKFVRIKSSGEVFYHYRAKVNKKIDNVPFSLQIVITIIIIILLSINQLPQITCQLDKNYRSNHCSS